MNTESGHGRCTITGVTASVQQVNGVCSRFGVRVGSKEVQAVGKSFLHGCLKAVVVARALCERIAVVLAEVRERNSSLGRGNGSASGSAIKTGSVCKLGASRQESGRIVGVRKDLKVPRQRSHIARLDRQAGRELVLQGEVPAHRVWRLIVELNSSKPESVGKDQRRI